MFGRYTISPSESDPYQGNIQTVKLHQEPQHQSPTRNPTSMANEKHPSPRPLQLILRNIEPPRLYIQLLIHRKPRLGGSCRNGRRDGRPAVEMHHSSEISCSWDGFGTFTRSCVGSGASVLELLATLESHHIRTRFVSRTTRTALLIAQETRMEGELPGYPGHRCVPRS